MTFIRIYFLTILVFISCSFSKDKATCIFPGQTWLDTDGKPINAHGGGLLFDNGKYYWYGEIKQGKTWRVAYITSWECYRVNAGGISCYSSTDLINWKYEGIALTANSTDSTNDLHYTKVIERPKVIFNSKTNKYVMWIHVDSEDYSYARCGVAVSDSPTGPFTYIGSEQPYSQMSRDMTLFKDSDGKAYHIFSSENNKTLYISKLTDDYLKHSPLYTRAMIDLSREAPAIIKHNKKYYLVSSACTGWAPNMAQYAIADSMFGQWQTIGNPCIGHGNDTTFGAQSTYILPLNNDGSSFIFIADKWNKFNLEGSRYIWLPGKIENRAMKIQWKDNWSPSSAY